jgi:protein subunit release factor B
MTTYTLPTHLCDFRFVLASGPGGQHVNKTATAVELRIPLAKLGPATRRTWPLAVTTISAH